MKVLVTAGGTTEQIDNVRGISNISSGKLGCLTASYFSIQDDVDEVFYVCGKKSKKPDSDNVNIIVVNTVAKLREVVETVLAENKIDIIIHSMAVSDYRVKAVTSVSNLMKKLQSDGEELSHLNAKDLAERIPKCLDESDSVIGGEGKIRSNIDDMLLLMERTPKVISLFKDLAPDATLVGFKLLDNVSRETLINTAYNIMKINQCSFVLANDLQEITGDAHTGYLVDTNKKYNTYHTKEEIAKGIVEETMTLRRA